MLNPIIIFLANLSRWGVGIVFIVAGFLKFLNPEEFMRVISNYNLLPLFLVPAAAIVLPWFEFLCGICLISKRFIKSAASSIALLLILFIIAMVINIFRGVQTDCGCFGLLFGDSQIGSFSVFRNSILLGLTLFIVLIASYDSSPVLHEFRRLNTALLMKFSLLLFGLSLILLSLFQLYEINALSEKYIETRINLSRITAETREYKAQLSNFELEKRLIGRRIPNLYVEQYLKQKKTLVLLATSQDCAPCTESELNLWKEFLKNNKIGFNILCLYYRYGDNQYGKYENVYKSIFPFMYDQDKLYEYLKINDTPIALLIDSEGNIINAHRPDVLHSEQTRIFLSTLSQRD